MAHSGQILDNPISGEQIIFHKTAAQTNGELLSLELRLAADGQVRARMCTRPSKSASTSRAAR